MKNMQCKNRVQLNVQQGRGAPLNELLKKMHFLVLPQSLRASGPMRGVDDETRTRSRAGGMMDA
jgi:hypothetical protein